MNSCKQILALEPFFGGSHRAFLDGWLRHSRHYWTLMTLPARHWKWRMRHAQLWFAQQARDAWQAGQRWDTIICSDMLDLAQFRGLCPPAIARFPSMVYFHENQLTYPVQRVDPRDLHFAITNFTTAVAADRVWFNSDFHRRQFLDALRQRLNKMPDFQPTDELSKIEAKSSVQSPGVEVPSHSENPTGDPLRIVWAARWEYDKDPDTFFRALRLLKQQGYSFRLIVCGQSFRETPAIFADARREFDRMIDHWGYVESRPQYLKLLSSADIIVSTALHEFFGLSVMEGIAADLFPLLPERLSYPELLDLANSPAAASFFYDGSAESLVDRLADLIKTPALLHRQAERHVLQQATERYQWKGRAAKMDDAIGI